MKEILFRGKDADSNEWCYGYYARFENMHEVKSDVIYTGYADIHMGCLLPECYDVKPETVGQYTGLKDKNGKKVFVGGIIRVYTVETQETQRSWNIPVCFGEYVDVDSCFKNTRCVGFYLDLSKSFSHKGYNIGLILDKDFECEVIGNVFDNPELLQ